MMKNFLSVFMVFFLVIGLTVAQEEKPAEQTATDDSEQVMDGPKMVFEKTEVDYGDIEQGSDPYREFPFTNEGNAPLIIKRAKGSCGCTVPEYPKEPIAPGESGVIKVRYDTNRIGPFSKSVRLTTNEEGPQHILRIKGKVDRKDPEPESVPAGQKNILNSDS